MLVLAAVSVLFSTLDSCGQFAHCLAVFASLHFGIHKCDSCDSYGYAYGNQPFIAMPGKYHVQAADNHCKRQDESNEHAKYTAIEISTQLTNFHRGSLFTIRYRCVKDQLLHIWIVLSEQTRRRQWTQKTFGGRAVLDESSKAVPQIVRFWGVRDS